MAVTMLDTSGYTADFSTLSYDGECPEVPTLVSNCSGSEWCVVGVGGSGACSSNGTADGTHCTWSRHGIFDVGDFPLDCETVDLSYNNISKLHVRDLETLETSDGIKLDLSYNNLTTLEGFKIPQSIHRLNLSNNFLESVEFDPDDLSPYTLDISNNPVTSISTSNSSIIYLYATDVQVSDMANVSISSSTIYLFCSINVLTEFKNFVPAASTALSYLDMSNGTIEKVHRTNFTEASYLTTLNFAWNPVSIVEGVLFAKNLKNLWFNGSNITSFIVQKSDLEILNSLESFEAQSLQQTNCSGEISSVTIGGVDRQFCAVDDVQFIKTYYPESADELTPSNQWLVPVAVAILGFGVTFVILLATYVYRQRKQRAIDANATRSAGGQTGGSVGSHQSILDGIREDKDLAAYRVSQDEVTLSRVLAKGGFGMVWIATLRGTEVIVVKQLLPDKAKNARVVANFVEEIRLCARLTHPKIVRFLGISWATLADLSILLEYMPNGDLSRHLRKSMDPKSSRKKGTPVASAEDVYSWTSNNGIVPGRTKLQLALDVAEALVYLHSFDKPIIHRDLKAQNVLLSSTWEAKLTDFGVSREVDEAMTAEVGTVAWIAPEILKGDSYSQQADIYSFGVLLAEMDTHDKPYAGGIPGSDGQAGQEPSNARIALAVIEKRLQPSFRSDCPPEILALARKCLSYEASSRPTAEELVRELVDSARPSQVSSHSSSESAESNGSYVVI